MNREDITKLAIEAGCGGIDNFEVIERFAALVAAAERERIKQANAPENESINAYIKAIDGVIAAERQRVRASMRRAFGRMAAFVRSEEREACAKLCENQPMRQDIDVRDQCAAAIRARKENT